GGKLATHLLIQKGCKKIAHISGNLQLQLLANKRSQAFIELSKEHGIESVIVETELNVFDITQYEAMIRNLLEKHPDIDGVFASSDVM
ncbi:substrate-binding domain-containing protein, partial [Salmonella enterica]